MGLSSLVLSIVPGNKPPREAHPGVIHQGVDDVKGSGYIGMTSKRVSLWAIAMDSLTCSIDLRLNQGLCPARCSGELSSPLRGNARMRKEAGEDLG